VPNFFIVGAAKSGTTSLLQYLRQHPEIYMPADIALKEPSYYCDTYGVEGYEAYLSLFFKAVTTERRVGEASTPYLTSPESARKIYDDVPDARIIILLRNPVDRAYSLWKWMHAYGYETIGSFEEALKAEFYSRKDNLDFIRKFQKGSATYYWDFLYFHSGLYFDQVKRYCNLFSKKQLAVIIFEEFIEKPLQFVHELYEFLDVDADFDPEIKIHNEGVSGYNAMNVNTQLDLRQRYLHDVTRLSELLNRDLNSFWFQ
jgi:Sulfotransferase domain